MTIEQFITTIANLTPTTDVDDAIATLNRLIADARQLVDDPRRITYDTLLEALADNVTAWEDEEQSVKTEHARLIRHNRLLLRKAGLL